MKYCPKCGGELKGTEIFCPSCGANLNEDANGNTANKQVKKMPKKRKKVGIAIGVVLVILIAIFMIPMDGESENNPLKTAFCEAYLLPEEFGTKMTVIEALNTLCGEDQYECMEREDGSVDVTYTAKTVWLNETVSVELKFTLDLDNNSVTPVSMIMDGIPMDPRFMDAFLLKCEGYDTLSQEVLDQWSNGQTESYFLEMKAEREAAKEEAKKIEEEFIAELNEDEEISDEHVLFVKNGYPSSYPDCNYGDVFDFFFASPTWKYFEGENGEDVVEFTGYCIYLEQEVKARLQFILDMDNGTFETGAMSFNDVPQTQLITVALIEKAFSEYANKEFEGAEADLEISQNEQQNIVDNESSSSETKSFCGKYEAKFDDGGGAEIEIIYASGDGEFYATFNGSYYDAAGETEGYLFTETDGFDGIWNYRAYDDEEYSYQLQYDGQDTIVVGSLNGNTYGGINFPGFSGTYMRTEEYPMP